MFCRHRPKTTPPRDGDVEHRAETEEECDDEQMPLHTCIIGQRAAASPSAATPESRFFSRARVITLLQFAWTRSLRTMKGATNSDRRESSVSERMEPKHTSGPASHIPARRDVPAVPGTRVRITPTPQKRLPTPFVGIGGDAEWVGCGRGSLAVRGTVKSFAQVKPGL